MVGKDFMGLQHKGLGKVIIILLASILGILGSYGVAWFGIRIDTGPTPAPPFRPSKATRWRRWASRFVPG